MRRFYAFVLSSVVTLSIIMGCSPKAVSTPAPVTQSTPAPVTQPAATAPASGPDDSNWSKVVEAAKKEGMVTVYSFDFTGDVATAVSAALKSQYGIKLEAVTGFGVQLAERIRAEHTAGKFIADEFDTAVGLVNIAKTDGRLEPWGPLPVLQEKDIWQPDPKVDDGYMLSFASGLNTPYVNTTLVKKGEEPKSYKDLLDPRWKGKIIVPSPRTAPAFGYVYVMGRRGGFLDDEFFRRLSKQDLKIAPTIRDSETMLIRGEGAIAVPHNEDLIMAVIAQGAPARGIEMQEGVMLGYRSVASRVKNGPHPNATKVFINWLLSKEGQAVFHKVKSTRPVRKDVSDFRPAAYRMEPTKTLLLGLSEQLEAAKIQNDGSLARLLGVEQ